MKKSFLFLSAMCLCFTMLNAREYPARLSMVGGAVATGWNIGETYMETIEDGVYTYVGALNKGELKFLADYDWVPSYGPATKGETLATGSLTYRADYDAPDNAYNVEAGTYKIDIDLATQTITVADGTGLTPTVQPTYPVTIYPTGEAFEWGWSLDGFAMHETAFNSGKYEDTITLKAGEMKFMLKHDFGAKLYGPVANGDKIEAEGVFTLTEGTDDKKWNNTLMGEYVITVDAATMSLTIRKPAPTALSATKDDCTNARKEIRDGQLLIISADKAYNVLGIQL